MKLLIVTQKVDRSDPILGFFHRWLELFAAEVDELIVLTQYVGHHELPSNVRVVSLGKENGASNGKQIIAFWKNCFAMRHDYDTVLVHMTPIWMVLGGPLWLLLHKRRHLWYEARGGGWALPTSLLFVRKVFSATAYGLPISSHKSVVTGHGIDTERFAPSGEPYEKGLIVTVGRTTRVKHLDVIISAFATLGGDTTLFIAGGPITAEDRIVLEELESLMARLQLRHRVEMRFVSHDDVRALLQRAEVVLHACGGGLDKIVLESMAVGCPIVSSSYAAKAVLPTECICTEETMSNHLRSVVTMTHDQRDDLSRRLRATVESSHSLSRLIPKIVSEMSS